MCVCVYMYIYICIYIIHIVYNIYKVWYIYIYMYMYIHNKYLYTRLLKLYLYYQVLLMTLSHFLLLTQQQCFVHHRFHPKIGWAQSPPIDLPSVFKPSNISSLQLPKIRHHPDISKLQNSDFSAQIRRLRPCWRLGFASSLWCW